MTRKKAREQAFILIFEKFFRGDDTLEEIVACAEECENFEEDEFSVELFYGVYANLESIDELIKVKISGWKIERISSVARAALRLAIYEINYVENIPVSVSINEAVELCKKFGTSDDASYVNGVLGTIARSKEE